MPHSQNVAVRRALISVSDKTGIVEFAQALAANKVELLSTGGTYKLLKENNIAEVAAAGADVFVAGSAIFGQKDYRQVIARFKEIIGET